MALWFQRCMRGFPYHHNPLMWAIGFIAGKQIDICADGINIWQTMRAIRHPIHQQYGIGIMHHIRDFPDGINLSHQIGTMGHGDHGDTIIQQTAQCVQIKLSGYRVGFPD